MGGGGLAVSRYEPKEMSSKYKKKAKQTKKKTEKREKKEQKVNGQTQ